MLIFIFHFVGMLGLTFPKPMTFFIFNAISFITNFILLLASRLHSKKFFLSTFFIVFFGFLIEVIGVYTGILFGGYEYGDNLGLQVFSVPLVIGLNWFILVFGTRGVVNYFFDKKYLQIILSSILMVLLDFLIEPVAIEFGWWSWDIVSVPLQNYIMWFLVSLIMQFVISRNNNEISKSISFSLLLSQIIFFIYLNIVII